MSLSEKEFQEMAEGIRVRLPPRQVRQRLQYLARYSRELSDGEVVFLIQDIQGPEEGDALEGYLLIRAGSSRKVVDKGWQRGCAVPSAITIPREVLDEYKQAGQFEHLLTWGHREEGGDIVGVAHYFGEGNHTRLCLIPRGTAFHDGHEFRRTLERAGLVYLIPAGMSFDEAIGDVEPTFLYVVFQFLRGYFDSLSPLISEKQRGPNIKTQERAMVFRRLKEEHPEWTQERVAMEACEELRENVTGETVRRAYRLMRRAYPDQADEWTWERADRIR